MYWFYNDVLFFKFNIRVYKFFRLGVLEYRCFRWKINSSGNFEEVSINLSVVFVKENISEIIESYKIMLFIE